MLMHIAIAAVDAIYHIGSSRGRWRPTPTSACLAWQPPPLTLRPLLPLILSVQVHVGAGPPPLRRGLSRSRYDDRYTTGEEAAAAWRAAVGEEEDGSNHPHHRF